jgi:hypothetical protein
MGENTLDRVPVYPKKLSCKDTTNLNKNDKNVKKLCTACFISFLHKKVKKLAK